MTKELYHPFIDTLMYALPHTFSDVEADNGTTVSLEVTTDVGGQWNVVKKSSGWVLSNENTLVPTSKISIDPDTAWKLFSKSRTSEQVMDSVQITGEQLLGEQALKMVAVMA